MGDTVNFSEDFSSKCVFPPLPRKDPRKDSGDTRNFTTGEAVCLRSLGRGGFNSPHKYKKGIYENPFNVPGFTTGIDHIITVDNEPEMFHYTEVGKLILKENVMKNIVEKKTGKEFPSNILRGWGRKTRKTRKTRKVKKSRKSIQKT